MGLSVGVGVIWLTHQVWVMKSCLALGGLRDVFASPLDNFAGPRDAFGTSAAVATVAAAANEKPELIM